MRRDGIWIQKCFNCISNTGIFIQYHLKQKWKILKFNKTGSEIQRHVILYNIIDSNDISLKMVLKFTCIVDDAELLRTFIKLAALELSKRQM